MNQIPSKITFEHLVSNNCSVQNIHCVQMTNLNNNTPITICSYNEDPTRSLLVACPNGGITFKVQKAWEQTASTTLVQSNHERHDASSLFTVVSKDIHFTSATQSLISDKLKLHSSLHPLDIHSFSAKKNGLNIKCPKGGVMIQSGSGGIVQSTTGNVECQLDNENTHIKLATRGSKKHTILLGNMNTETIVENQLTIRGKLVLSDDSIVEKHVSVVHELQNIVELACQNSNSSSTYDYGLVAKQRDKTSGVIYDHIRDMFYFSTELGSYQQNRFSLPKQYATVQAKSYIAQQKITSAAYSSGCQSSSGACDRFASSG